MDFVLQSFFEQLALMLLSVQKSTYLVSLLCDQGGRVVKALDLRSYVRMHAWVQIPSLVIILKKNFFSITPPANMMRNEH